MAIHDDIPPPYTKVGTHGVFPKASHDERTSNTGPVQFIHEKIAVATDIQRRR